MKKMQTVLHVIKALNEQARKPGVAPEDIIFRMVLAVLLLTPGFRRPKNRARATEYLAEEIENHLRAAEEQFENLSPSEQKAVVSELMWPGD